jgi:hypothetical protein
MTDAPTRPLLRDITLARAAVNAACSLLVDVDWDALLDDCHHALALIDDPNMPLPPSVTDRDEARAITVHNMGAINAARTYLRTMRKIGVDQIAAVPVEP